MTKPISGKGKTAASKSEKRSKSGVKKISDSSKLKVYNSVGKPGNNRRSSKEECFLEFLRSLKTILKKHSSTGHIKHQELASFSL